jgi:SRSO17 transposase
MRRTDLKRLDAELSAYLDELLPDLGKPARRSSESYVLGLLLDGERKSIAPMAMRLVDHASEAEAMRQRLQECVVLSKWLDDDVRQRLAAKLEAEFPSLEALVVDDTGIPKKGEHSVGVQRQYSGTLGRTDNCQVATSLHVAGNEGSACIGFRLYLSEDWAADAARRRKTQIPDDVGFLRKWEIAIAQLDDALRWGVRKHVVLADCGYGDASEFRDALTARGLPYLVGVKGTHSVWPPGVVPYVPRRRGSRGRAPTIEIHDTHEPIRIAELAASLPASAFHRVTWREGSRGRMSSRFAFLRVRNAERRTKRKRPKSVEQWLICEWPAGEDAPTKFYLSSLPPTTTRRRLVHFVKLRWRVERDYQELKQEIGLDHFEGRTWRGFHHHATLCSVAHAFLALQRALFPPVRPSLDAADGQAPSAIRPAPSHRSVPALQTTR